MKRISISITTLIVAVVLGLILSGALIAQQDSSKTQSEKMLQEKSQTRATWNEDSRPMGRGMNFIDENGNGICDHFEGMQNMGPNAGRGHGPGFMDEDGDGVCDHSMARGMHNGQGHGHGNHSRDGHGSMGRGSSD